MTTLPGAPPGADGIPFGTRIGQVAAERPDEVALVFAAEDGGERTVTWGELDRRSTRLAHVLAGRGLGPGDILAVCLRNSPEHLISSFAAWKVGATVVPVRWDLPAWERSRVLATLAPRLLVDADHLDVFEESRSAPEDPLPEVVSPHGWGVCSSGSTGTPKVILVKNPGLFVPGFGGVSSVVEAYGKLPMPQRVLVPAPLYHTNGFTATRNLMAGVPVVLLERFSAPRILDLVERHRVTGFIGATPMLQRIAQVPGIEDRDLSSLDWVQQGASPLPVWLGRQWCELVGPERFYMSYGASEMHGLVTCRGDEWLEHPGTLGRAFGETEIRILDQDGKELPEGEVGMIYMRTPTGPAAFYVGDDVAPMPATDDGFVTVGDLGWLEDGGFLFLADRRVDMIVTGAANVFPAEVESALSEHPAIADVVVVGLRDPEWGRRVHAIVQPAEPATPPHPDEVIRFAKERLAAYKVPKSVELVEAIHRNDAMKLNRAALVAERDGPEEPGAGPLSG
ncbi:MAG: class I adenylate-forming enzyme family protein [Acidimicrobiales bacterium]